MNQPLYNQVATAVVTELIKKLDVKDTQTVDHIIIVAAYVAKKLTEEYEAIQPRQG